MSTHNSTGELAAELVQIADQLRTLSNNGLMFTQDPYQIERYQKILGLSARLLGLVDSRPAAEIRRILFDDLDFKTPAATVDTAVFDGAERLLLIRRTDDGLWAMPGGACDVGEAPATGAVREVWEETGYLAQVTHLIGVFDSRYAGTRSSRHLYHFLFAGHVSGGSAVATMETLDVGWFTSRQVPWGSLSPGHAERIRWALEWKAEPERPPFFDRETWEPGETYHHVECVE